LQPIQFGLKKSSNTSLFSAFDLLSPSVNDVIQLIAIAILLSWRSELDLAVGLD
jgi:hypothetical protein